MSRGRINGRKGLSRPRVVQSTLKSSVLQENRMTLLEKMLVKELEENHGKNFDRIITQFRTTEDWAAIIEEFKIALYCWQPLGAQITDNQAQKSLHKSNPSQQEVQERKQEMIQERAKTHQEILMRMLDGYFTPEQQAELIDNWEEGYDQTVLELLAHKHPDNIIANDKIPTETVIDIFNHTKSERRFFNTLPQTDQDFKDLLDFQQAYHQRLLLELATSPISQATGQIAAALTNNIWELSLLSLKNQHPYSDQLLAQSVGLWQDCSQYQDLNLAAILPEINTTTCLPSVWNKLRKECPKHLNTKDRVKFREARQIVEEKFAVLVALKVITVEKAELEYDWIEKAKTRALNKVKK